ncbi:low molecular weight protein tyrosine phosphatase family protein [Thiolinea disciformis]|uniref:low molecular weight protein tyrosine phosphatase family protein n=1 Tax=Thiolinea disciformis TaxID=125614 RepID=UPI000370B2CA|nr:low molecular weight protein tyrosine phosphatase family protein [Thiolinea disciformis]
MTHVLFVCSKNRLRSPTAEQVFSQWSGIETDSAGLDHGADLVLSSEQVEWAELIFVMEAKHRQKLKKQFGAYLKAKKVICLNIPDDYKFMQPELIQLLEEKVSPYLATD